jgi:pimeloyl-ACP methyl ester carboxylesterase
MPANMTFVPFKTNLLYPHAGSQPNEIAIMVHGFLEGIDSESRARERWIKRYETIAEELAQRNIASIFLPMPLHFERMVPAAEGTASTVVQRLKNNGSFLYYGGHDQFSTDIGILIESILAEPTKYRLAPVKPKIHLIGYSLGGAAAMAAATSNHGRVDSLSVLYSTWGLANIPSEAIGAAFEDRYGFSAADWNATMAKLASERDSFDKAFQAVMWGEISPSWISLFPKRVLFVHGLKDELFPPEMTVAGSLAFFNQFSSMVQGLDAASREQFEVAFINSYSDHFFFRRRKQVAAMIASFIGVSR